MNFRRNRIFLTFNPLKTGIIAFELVSFKLFNYDFYDYLIMIFFFFYSLNIGF